MRKGIKKTLSFGIVSLFLISLSVAAWASFYNPSTTGLIISSSEPVLFSDNFELRAVDVTNNSAEEWFNVYLDNRDGTRVLNVDATLNQTDVNDGCPDYINDVDYSIEYGGDILNPNGISNITVPSGSITEIRVSMNATQNSCPQTVSLDLTLEG